jgi:hypothetical protein
MTATIIGGLLAMSTLSYGLVRVVGIGRLIPYAQPHACSLTRILLRTMPEHHISLDASLALGVNCSLR